MSSLTLCVVLRITILASDSYERCQCCVELRMSLDFASDSSNGLWIYEIQLCGLRDLNKTNDENETFE